MVGEKRARNARNARVTPRCPSWPAAQLRRVQHRRPGDLLAWAAHPCPAVDKTAKVQRAPPGKGLVRDAQALARATCPWRATRGMHEVPVLQCPQRHSLYSMVVHVPQDVRGPEGDMRGGVRGSPHLGRPTLKQGCRWCIQGKPCALGRFCSTPCFVFFLLRCLPLRGVSCRKILNTRLVVERGCKLQFFILEDCRTRAS